MKDTVKNKEIELDTSGTECPIPVLKARKLGQSIGHSVPLVSSSISLFLTVSFITL